MNLQTYFSPIDTALVAYEPNTVLPAVGERVQAYWQEGAFPDPTASPLVLLGVADGRGTLQGVTPPGHPCAADAVRHHLYALAVPDEDFSCVDLGNMVPGATFEDTCFALTEVLTHLLEMGSTVVILGESQALTWAAYKAYATLGRIINVAAVDSSFDIEEHAVVDSRSWLYHMVLHQPNYLFNYAGLGYQNYLCGRNLTTLMEELQFDVVRLGALQENDSDQAEPLLRWSDMVSVDIGAVRHSDAPGHAPVMPHGLYGEELCRLMRFAGMSDKVSTLGMYELHTAWDFHGQTAALVAQAVWHFLEGFYARLGDIPYRDTEYYRRFLVPLSGGQNEIVFYKSKKSDRWWFEVPCDTDENRTRYERHLLVPCTYNDYQQALKNELPDRYLKVLQRVN